MNRLASSVVALIASAGLASAQSFNIDINTVGGLGSGMPSTTFAGAAGQIGMWNGISPATSSSFVTTPLLDVGGTSTGAMLQRVYNGSGSGIGNANAGGSADYGMLFSDYQQTQGFDGSTYTLTGLQAGTYALYAYASLPPSQASYFSGGQTLYHENLVTVHVGAASLGTLITSNVPVVPGTFQEGRTHRIFTFTLPANTALALDLRGNSNAQSKAALNGVQLVKYPGSRLYVKSGAAGANNGSSWANAFSDLQAALNFAAASNGVFSEVWVAQGTYKPSSTGDRSASFHLANGLRILGGFAGNEVAASARDVRAHVTVLSGDLVNPMFSSDNSYNVVSATGVNTSAVLDGFTISGGNATGVSPADGGGGMIVSNASPTIRNCTFTGNTGNVGGAVNVELGGPVFAGCTFSNNTTTTNGGAIRFVGSNAFAPPFLHISHCVFISNHAAGGGGATYIVRGNTWFADSLFDNNSASGGGAVATDAQVSTLSEMYNCTLSANSAVAGGGALSIGGSASFTLKNSILWGNNAGGGGCGTLCRQIQVFAPSVVNHWYNCIQGKDASINGQGSIGVDPKFVNPAGVDGVMGTLDDNFHLAKTSPCLDAGSTPSVSTDLADIDENGMSYQQEMPIDLDGHSRRVALANILPTGQGPGPIADMGAYELASACVADVDDGSASGTPDGGVTIDDLLYYLAIFEAGTIQADVDDGSGTGTPDGGVTIDDLLYFLQRFEAGC